MTTARRRILVTRPEPGASQTAKALKARGYEAVVIPMFEIVVRPGGDDPLREALGSDPQGIAVTSANAARALATLFANDLPAPLRHLPVYALGEATAEACRQTGFGTVLAAPIDHGGDAKGLAAWMARHCGPDKGPILHVHGEHRAADLPALLSGSGLHVTACAIYASHSADGFTDKLLRQLDRAPIDAVLHYSPRAARHFVERSAGAFVPCHVCLSPAVAAALRRTLSERRVAAERIIAADQPNEQALFDALDRVDQG